MAVNDEGGRRAFTQNAAGAQGRRYLFALRLHCSKNTLGEAQRAGGEAPYSACISHRNAPHAALRARDAQPLRTLDCP